MTGRSRIRVRRGRSTSPQIFLSNGVNLMTGFSVHHTLRRQAPEGWILLDIKEHDTLGRLQIVSNLGPMDKTYLNVEVELNIPAKTILPLSIIGKLNPLTARGAQSYILSGHIELLAKHWKQNPYWCQLTFGDSFPNTRKQFAVNKKTHDFLLDYYRDKN